MAKVILPQSLIVLFPGAPRQIQVTVGTVQEVIDRLNDAWPGMRSRLLDAGPALWEHIIVSVDGQAAGLTAPVRPDAEVRIIPAITGG